FRSTAMPQDPMPLPTPRPLRRAGFVRDRGSGIRSQDDELAEIVGHANLAASLAKQRREPAEPEYDDKGDHYSYGRASGPVRWHLGELQRLLGDEAYAWSEMSPCVPL